MSAAATASAAVAPASPTVDASSKKRKPEPTEKELAQSALLAELFDAKNSRVIASTLRVTAGQSPSKKQKTEAAANQAAAAEEFNPFVAAMDATPTPGRRANPTAFTANGAVSHATTKAPNLDLFFHLARGYTQADINAALPLAWAENPETCLKVLMHARDAHGKNGKGERLVVYHALMWLRIHKPRTYIQNLVTFLGLGYFKDLANLIDLIDGNEKQPYVKQPKVSHKKGRRMQQRGGTASNALPVKGSIGASFKAAADAKKAAHEAESKEKARRAAAAASRMGPIGNAQFELQLFAEYLKQDYIKLKKWNHDKKMYKQAKKEQAAAATPAASKAATTASNSTAWFDNEEPGAAELEDGEWTDLGQTTKQVRELDINAQAAEEEAKMTDVAPAVAASPTVPTEPAANCFISLAAKYAPSERHHFGSQAKRLAKILFGGETAQSSAGFTNAKHMQSCMKKYRTMLSTLRSHLCITERLACANRWDAINFNAVPSKCHQLLKKAFVRHCGDRYAEYLASLKKGKAGVKINVTGLQPHELVAYYLAGNGINETVEEAWKALVSKTAEAGTFKGAVSVVDVSGSMSGLPMNVAIAMGLLVSELCEGVYRGRVLTFHESPSWYTIQGETLKEKVDCLARAPWGGSTNLQATFDLILDVAKKNKVAQQHLPQTLFIYSDMQFDSAVGGRWMETNYDTIKRKYAAAGYQTPSIVFWNVNGALCKDTPIQCDTVGCALMSGFSATLLNVFLTTPIVADPQALSMAAIDVTDPKQVAAAEEAAKQNPLHPLRIMMDSLAEYVAVVDEAER